MNLEALIADVADSENGLVCDHWTSPLHDVSVRFLTELGLVKPITTRIPACSEHGCLILDECVHRETFEKRIGTRGGIKAKLTPAGQNAFAHPEVLSRALGEHRMVQTIRAAIAEQPHTLFELYALFLSRCRRELETTGKLEESVFFRQDVKGCLELLEGMGELVWDRKTGCVSAT